MNYITELNDTWVWRWHVKDKTKNYQENTKIIAEFSTIEAFWKYYNNIPKPTEFFKNKQGKYGIINDFQVHSWSVFRKGIESEWEDPKNINGGEVNIRSFQNFTEINFLWENCLLILLGEQVEYSEHITGARVVDSSSDYKSMYRIEIWYDHTDIEEEIKKDIEKIFMFPETSVIYKKHK